MIPGFCREGAKWVGNGHVAFLNFSCPIFFSGYICFTVTCLLDSYYRWKRIHQKLLRLSGKRRDLRSNLIQKPLERGLPCSVCTLVALFVRGASLILGLKFLFILVLSSAVSVNFSMQSTCEPYKIADTALFWICENSDFIWVNPVYSSWLCLFLLIYSFSLNNFLSLKSLI